MHGIPDLVFLLRGTRAYHIDRPRHSLLICPRLFHFITLACDAVCFWFSILDPRYARLLGIPSVI